MGKTVSLIIDSQPISVPQGTMVVDAAKQLGINIPVFCYHPKMEPVGMCRMCLVEIGRPVIDKNTGEFQREAGGEIKILYGPKLETSCTTPVSEGMVVNTATDKVKVARKEVVEFLLTSHPLDCPICDKGGECPLQNLTMEYGPGQSRFNFNEKIHHGKRVPLGDLILLDRERCIQCGRCVRFQSDVADEPVIGFSQRGRALEIVSGTNPGFDSIFSANTTDICPVGALTTVDFRFGSRPWDLKATASICTHCAVGCNIVYNVRREVASGGAMAIKRVMPRQNEQVNEIWICDKARFAYHYAEDKARITEPMVKKNGQLVAVSWDEALEFAAEKVKSVGSKLVTLAGGRLSNEDLFTLQKAAKAVNGKSFLYSHMAGGDLVAKLGPGQGSNFADMGKGSVILVAACDLHEEAPLWWLRVKGAIKRGAILIVINPRQTELEKGARYVIRCDYGDVADTLKSFIPVNQSEAAENIRAAAQVFAKADNGIIIYGSEGMGATDSGALARVCAEVLMTTEHVGRPNNGLLAAWPHANTQGAWDMGFQSAHEEHLEAAIKDAAVIWIAAADPAGDDPEYRKALAGDPFVIVQELFLTETALLADVVFPAQAAAERDGTYTSAERRVQRFYQAIPALSGTKADHTITAMLANKAGLGFDAKSTPKTFEDIAANFDAYSELTYASLANPVEQYPLVGREDVYYGGTTYENRMGVGVQLIPAVQKVTIKLDETPASSKQKIGDGAFRVVPVTRLYDHGSLLKYSPLLDGRSAKAVLRVHPETAQKENVVEGKQYQVNLRGEYYTLEICLDDTVPAGVGLLPRSVGIPLVTAQAVQLLLIEGN